MRRVTLAVSGLLIMLVGKGLVGCAQDCTFDATCAPPDGGGGGGTPVECIPSMNTKPVATSCGVFVSSSRGEDGNEGSQSAPVKTLQAALTKAKGKPVYACAEAFTESVTVASGSALFGGVDCEKGWAYVGVMTKTALTGEPDKIALTLASTAKGAEVVDFAIQAASAMAPGGSSIAVVADQVEAGLTRCDLTAGDGAPGADGENASSTPATAGAGGKPGGNACSGDSVLGGAQVENDCAMESSIGGDGGNGNKSNGGNGQPGQTGNLGKEGAGEPAASGTWSCAVQGTGQGGDPGKEGDPGHGAGTGSVTSDLGKLSASGFASAAGRDGSPGKAGQGGGGGGGAKGGSACGGTSQGGASGGSGGAGGCGGASGKGGQGGGASIALVSLNANLTLTEVTLKAGNGGKGGAGGKSQAGSAGGTGGVGGSNLSISGIKAGCDGGKGGPGGDGGAGGGGRGGHSIGLAYLGTAPVLDMEKITPGTAGNGGDGGNNNAKSNAGAAGVSAAVQSFE